EAGKPIVVVRVLSPRPPGAHRESAKRDEAAVVFDGHADAACRRLQDSAWRAELVEASSPAAGLATAARQHRASAIVVGSSHGHRHGCGVLGTEPYQLFAEADVPVVVIPPQAG